ncbi:hypothetical protein YYC_04749 [Plasmodium yoelii 17X]|uniref:RIIa domain-containing protein n=1 Tax=Plasmodium yoelii 17X TaxID=1323249 RepID=V7PG53_PLAYE|nr:hypothetical protein YYC_04749 [Plasmodium yoelii 17X]
MEENSFEFKKVEKINLDSYEIPKYFEEILSEFVAKLLQCHPDNVYKFAFNYFDQKSKNL